MFRNPAFATLVSTGYLLVYLILLFNEATLGWALLLLSASPFVLFWLVYTVIRYGKFPGKEFTEEQEWGYQDRNSREMGIF
jgi:hypothetical protein